MSGVVSAEEREHHSGEAARGLAYITQVEDDLTAYPIEAVSTKKPYAGVGPYPLARYRGTPTPLHQHIAAADPSCWQQVTWREGSRGTMSGYFTAIRVRPAGRKHTHRLNPDGSLDPAWLLVQWPTPDSEGTSQTSGCRRSG